MSKHEKQDPEDLSKKNGYKPGVRPPDEPRGKHGKPDTDDKDKDDKDNKR